MTNRIRIRLSNSQPTGTSDHSSSVADEDVNNGNKTKGQSTSAGLGGNPLLDLLPTWNNSKNSNQISSQGSDQTTVKPVFPESIFDITQLWETSKEETPSFWSRVLGDVPETSKGDKRDNNETDDKKLNTIDISEQTAASSTTSKHALDEYSDKAQQRDPELPYNRPETPDKGFLPKDLLKPFEGLLEKNSDKNDNHPEKKKKKKSAQFQNRATQWMGYLSSPTGGTEQSIRDMIDTARESISDEDDDDDVTDEKSFNEVLQILRQYAGEFKGTAGKYFGNVDLSQLYPTSLFYYIEAEDAKKNPSWKRRMHRFYRGVGVDRMNQLNDYLTLARISYFDAVQEVKERLGNLTVPLELVYCDVGGEPGKPAHYLAIQQQQQPLSPALEMVLGIRGTKTLTDAITDLLFEETPYRGGKAHSGILNSGQFIAEKHAPLLKKLLDSSGKSRIKLLLVGHSLGAGVASIAAMEFNDSDNIDVEVVGFGCPALLSKDLCEQLDDYVTTVIVDDDVVPRLSAPTVINALLDVMEYDYVPSARRDIEHAMHELKRLYPLIVTDERVEKALDFIDPLLEKYIVPTIKSQTTYRMERVLFPPGNIIHFYRDGVGISGSINMPCTFFDQIDLKRSMIDDHLFRTGYERLFLDIMRLHYQDHSFQFENPVTPVSDECATDN